MYYPSYVHPHRDETIIPILYSSQSHQTTPVKMRILLKSPSLSVPRTRRIYSDNDHRYIQYPYHPIVSSPLPPPPPTRSFYTPVIQQQYMIVDPYRTAPSYSGDTILRSDLPSSHHYPYSSHRFSTDSRLLSQRLWDIDSGDDEDEIEENFPHIRSQTTSIRERLKDFHSSHVDNEDHIILHIGDDEDEEEESYNKKLVYI
jgi:hypothetical protein